MIRYARMSWLLLACCGIVAACHKGASVSEPLLAPIVVPPGQLAMPSPAVVADVALAKAGAWRVAVVSPATMTTTASAAIWDLREAPEAGPLQLPGVAWVALDRDDGAIFSATPTSGAEAEALPAIALTLRDVAGAEICRAIVNGTEQMKTAAMAVTSQGLAWVGSFSGALTVGAAHVTSAAETDGIAVFLTRSCQVTGVVRLAGPRGEGMATVAALPSTEGNHDVAADWLITGRFGDRAMLGDTPLEAAVANRRGLTHSLVVARVSSAGEVRWTIELSGGAPLFATASAITPNGRAVAIVGALRGPVTVRDASSSRPSLPALPQGSDGKPDVEATVNVSDGFFWQLDGAGAVQGFVRSPYLGRSDVNGVAFLGGQWLIAGQLRGAAPDLPTQRFGLFTASLVGHEWKTTQLFAATSPVVGWLAAVEGTSTAVLLSYDGAALQWRAALASASSAR